VAVERPVIWRRVFGTSAITFLQIAVMFIIVPPAAALGLEESPPNVVIFLADDMTWHDVGVYHKMFPWLPNNAVTPNIDKLAAQGVVFEKAFTATAMCSVARHQIYTGLYPVRSGGYANHSRVFNDTRSIVDYFSEHGYEVALAGKTHVYPKSVFRFLSVGGENKSNAGASTFGIEKTKKFLSSIGRKPFLLVVASANPHIPWNRGNVQNYPTDKIVVPPYLMDSNRLRKMLSSYLAEVSDLDREVGLIDNELERNGLIDNTIFVFSTEHGSDLPFGKWTAYDAGVRTALVVRWPQAIQPRTVSAIVELVDLLPTLLDLSLNQVPEDLDGRSFADLIRGNKDTHKFFAVGLQTSKNIHNGVPYPIRWIRTHRHKLIENLIPDAEFSSLTASSTWFQEAWEEEKSAGGHHYSRYIHRPNIEFYDLTRDPFELNNLIEKLSPAETLQLEEMRARLHAWMLHQNDLGVETEMAACQRKGFSHRGCP
jgi:N-sulfoglucosamine sulfohydrolase